MIFNKQLENTKIIDVESLQKINNQLQNENNQNKLQSL